MQKQYDIIIIGTGSGGGTIARKLAESGKRILILERGGFIPKEKQNWDPHEAPIFLFLPAVHQCQLKNSEYLTAILNRGAPIVLNHEAI